jgi:hypothetical protein
MGLREWWSKQRAVNAAHRRSLEIDSDQALIAQQVPELVGMSDVERMAYILAQIEEWNKTCSPEQAATLAGRLKASQKSWKNDGLTMPTWGNLWVLRTYQEELGQETPWVAPPVKS